ncbi:MAG TPA: CpaF family protein [Candidatus Dormibacteraeota bacterium]
MSLLDRTLSKQEAGAGLAGPPPAPPARGGVQLLGEAARAEPPGAPGSSSRRRLLPNGNASATLQRNYDEIRARVHSKLISVVDADTSAQADIRQAALDAVAEVVAAMGLSLRQQERHAIVEQILDDVLGMGPLEPLLKDPAVTDVLVNNWDRIYVERENSVQRVPLTFEDNTHLMRVIQRMLSAVGRRVDEATPMVDARLKDGSRVNVVIPPLSISGPTITVRRFAKDPLQPEDLIRFGTCTGEMMEFLAACVRARLNIAISGGGSSGKTSTLNVLSGFIPDDERIVTIEDAAELQLRQPHVVPLESRPANIEGRGRVSIRNLVINALRMRPDRIVVGECRGAEALDMLQAMNTGHDGSLTTLHANSPVDAVSRLEVMILMAGTDLPSKAIREQIGSAVQIFVHHARLRDGSRKIVRISECTGFDGQKVIIDDVFYFHQTGIDERGEVHGYTRPTGYVPRCLEVLEYSGNHIDPAIFESAAVVS